MTLDMFQRESFDAHLKRLRARRERVTKSQALLLEQLPKLGWAKQTEEDKAWGATYAPKIRMTSLHNPEFHYYLSPQGCRLGKTVAASRPSRAAALIRLGKRPVPRVTGPTTEDAGEKS